MPWLPINRAVSGAHTHTVDSPDHKEPTVRATQHARTLLVSVRETCTTARLAGAFQFGTMAMAATTAGGGKVQPRGPGAALSLLLLLLVLGGGAEAQQTCAGQLNGLAPCLRYSVPPLPGQAPPAPGAECCSALGAVSRDCACGTFGIINSLPAKCGLPPVSCQ